jgi:putative endonuclease
MPGSTTSYLKSEYYCYPSERYYWVYVLESLKDNKRYVGLTINLAKRIREHNLGRSFSTKPRRPFKLIYAEFCLNYEDAKRREHYLKTTGGRRFLVKRLKNYYLNK